MTDKATQENDGPLLTMVGDVFEVLGLDRATSPDVVLKHLSELSAAASLCNELQGQLAEVSAERDQLVAERDNLSAELDKAVARYQVHRRKHEGNGRPIGALKAVVDPADIAAAIDGPVELVFSDGKKEIPGIDPVHVSGGAAWSRHPTGMMLRDRVLLAGPAPGERAYAVAGVGLLVDGKQIGWCAFHDVVSVPGGATAELRDSIIF